MSDIDIKASVVQWIPQQTGNSCGGETFAVADVSVACLLQCLWGLLMSSTPLPRRIPKTVSFE